MSAKQNETRQKRVKEAAERYRRDPIAIPAERRPTRREKFGRWLTGRR